MKVRPRDLRAGDRNYSWEALGDARKVGGEILVKIRWSDGGIDTRVWDDVDVECVPLTDRGAQ